MAKHSDTAVTAIARRLPLRVPLALLQLVFAALLASHLGFTSVVSPASPSFLAGLVLLVVILFLPYPLLRTVWSIAGVTAANTAILLKQMATAGMVEPWHALGFVLVMLMASCSLSIAQFVGLGFTLCAVYALVLHRFGSLSSEEGLVIPVLLAMVMVLVKKTSVAHDQLRNRVATQDHAEAGTDALTGLANRAKFVEQVWRSMTVAENIDDFKFAILFVDLDGFKPINDSMGHKAGDSVLVETARRLRACLRAGDVAARYGGDEFTLLVNQVRGTEDAIRVAERVLQRVKEPILAGKRVQVGATIGIALSTIVHQNPEDLIRHADLAMYRAKSQGKGRYEVSDPLKETAVAARPGTTVADRDAAAAPGG